MEQVLEKLYGLVWGRGTVLLLVFSGLLLLLLARCYPLRHMGEILKKTVGSCLRGKEKAQGISPFDAMAAALGGTMGVGNIIGVAAALAVGGPGAVFWLWTAGLCGMMLKYGEVFLAVKYRVKTKDGWCGGPMYYIRDGLGSKALAALFAVCCVLASFGMGNMAQTNAVAGSLEKCFPLSVTGTALLIGLVTGSVILGGMTRIIRVSALVVPLMSLFYLAGALGILWVNRGELWQSVLCIFREAFGLQAAGGASLGLLWQAAQAGITKGIFTNEAGLGSASIAHACADEGSPHLQGLWGIFEVFADTLVVCTVTALVILSSGIDYTVLPPGQVTSAAFSSVWGSWGGWMVNLSVVFFAMASVFSWCLYGEKSLHYLGAGKRAIMGYRFCFIAFAVLGAVVRLELVWKISDILNGLMLFPNLFALLLLSPCFLDSFTDKSHKDGRFRI